MSDHNLSAFVKIRSGETVYAVRRDAINHISPYPDNMCGLVIKPGQTHIVNGTLDEVLAWIEGTDPNAAIEAHKTNPEWVTRGRDVHGS